jgi:hypothetical protein
MEILEENPNIVWEKRISKNGKEYHVGYPKIDEKTENLQNKVPFEVDVNWPRTDGEGDWIVQSGSFITTTAISRYKLLKQPWYKIYGTVLHFTCQEHYDYYFTDESGDIYNCNVYANGNHYVQYNSDRPNIMHIKGS